MTRRVFPLMLALLVLLSGCRLAQPDAGTATGSDLLVGVMLTPKPLDLFDAEAYFRTQGIPEDGAVIDDDAACQQRLYAADQGNGSWQFEGIEGFAFFHAVFSDENGSCSTMVNSGLSDGSYAVRETDDGSDIEIAGTLYVQPAEPIAWYFNPVYQDADGHIYLTSGSGFSMGGDNAPGASFMKTLSDNRTATDTDGAAHTSSVRCEVTVAVRALPEQLRLLWMDGSGQVLRRETYAPGQLPAQLDGRGAAYLIAELEDSTGAVERSLVQPDGDGTATLRSYVPGKWGTLTALDTPVVWD